SMDKNSIEPIIVKLEHKYYCNMTLIDTPGYDFDEAHSELVRDLIRAPHRHIFVVEEAEEWSQTQAINFVKQEDPELRRTTLIISKFHSYLSTLNKKTLETYLSRAPKMRHIFVSL